MKILPETSLPALSSDIKSRVSDGVYSLFILKADDSQEFALILKDIVFFLKGNGTIYKQQPKSNFDRSSILDAATFVIKNNDPLRINAA